MCVGTVCVCYISFGISLATLTPIVFCSCSIVFTAWHYCSLLFVAYAQAGTVFAFSMTLDIFYDLCSTIIRLLSSPKDHWVAAIVVVVDAFAQISHCLQLFKSLFITIVSVATIHTGRAQFSILFTHSIFRTLSLVPFSISCCFHRTRATLYEKEKKEKKTQPNGIYLEDIGYCPL